MSLGGVSSAGGKHLKQIHAAKNNQNSKEDVLYMLMLKLLTIA